jgi:hypothetical protein
MPFMLTIFALVLIVVTLVTVVGVLGFVIANVAIVALALLGGLAISALLGGVSPGTTIIATLGLMLLLLSAKQRRLDKRNRGYDIDAVAAPATRPKRRKPLPPGTAATPLDLAWAAVGEHADWARSRLAVAQESCRLFLQLADRQPLDMDAGGLAVRIRKRIPEHVAECLDKCELATPSERRTILEELVFTLEKVGASADRARSRLMGPATGEMEVQRRHLTREGDSDPIGLD